MGESVAKIIDGKAIGQTVRDEVAREVSRLKETGVVPGLAVVRVGDNPASAIYVRNKRKACEQAGIHSEEYDLPESTDMPALLGLVERLNRDPRIHGILVQLPLPKGLDEKAVLRAVDPAKDVDGFHPFNAGRLLSGDPSLVPCTPLGVLRMLKEAGVPLAGQEAVVVGRSNIVGKPMALLLLGENCTVTICHSRTRDLPAVCRRADILVAAVGRAEMVRGDWVKDGAAVIDVGINRLPDGKLIGDVAFEEARARAGWITPVPGGVGPMTIAMLLSNTIRAARSTL